MSCLVVLKMRMSSITQSTPGKPSRSECIVHCPLKVLWGTRMPKGSLLSERGNENDKQPGFFS